MSLRAAAAAWNRFFHDPIPPHAIAVYRVIYGLTLMGWIAMLVPHLHYFLGPHGVLSVDDARRLQIGVHFDLLEWWQSDTALQVLFILFTLAVLCLTVGLWTRISSVATFLLLLSFENRNPCILNAGDTMLRLAGFFLMFAPAGAALSIDAWRRGLPALPSPPWAQRMLQIQLSLAYLATWLLKTQGSEWVDGSAVYYATHLVEYQRWRPPYIFDHMWTLHLLTWGTLAIELVLAVLIWFVEVRYVVLAAGLLFHLALEVTMKVPMVEWAFVGLFVLWLDPDRLRSYLERMRPSGQHPRCPWPST
ncbi:MAG: HTTM domain-containing protein [Candidatus Xenobia bacterium]